MGSLAAVAFNEQELHRQFWGQVEDGCKRTNCLEHLVYNSAIKQPISVTVLRVRQVAFYVFATFFSMLTLGLGGLLALKVVRIYHSYQNVMKDAGVFQEKLRKMAEAFNHAFLEYQRGQKIDDLEIFLSNVIQMAEKGDKRLAAILIARLPEPLGELVSLRLKMISQYQEGQSLSMECYEPFLGAIHAAVNRGYLDIAEMMAKNLPPLPVNCSDQLDTVTFQAIDHDIQSLTLIRLIELVAGKVLIDERICLADCIKNEDIKNLAKVVLWMQEAEQILAEVEVEVAQNAQEQAYSFIRKISRPEIQATAHAYISWLKRDKEHFLQMTKQPHIPIRVFCHFWAMVDNGYKQHLGQTLEGLLQENPDLMQDPLVSNIFQPVDYQNAIFYQDGDPEKMY